MAANNIQTLRLRKPERVDALKVTPKPRHTGVLQDQLRRTAKPPWTPSFSLAFRILLLLRFSAAMYSNIQDCDEVYNFWEPLHYLDRGVGFQTWEVTPQYAIRSWAYVVLHLAPAWVVGSVLKLEKRQAFFAVRIFLAVISTYCEARFYRAVVETLNDRVGRYMLFMLVFSAGMWNASTAFLPSSFAMYTTLLAFSHALRLPSKFSPQRTVLATFFFAAGAIIGWPFSLLIAVPFLLEELFVYGADRVPASVWGVWAVSRVRRLVLSGLGGAMLIIPVVFIDTIVYGRPVVVPWNIIKYNIFGGSERGPDLYGSEPWYFYILNLLLNFNILLPLSLLSLPALALTSFVDRKRLGLGPGVTPRPPTPTPTHEQSSPIVIMFMRLVPLYLWLGVMTAQRHKEERFMYPVYPLVCFNAAVCVYLVRGWMERLFVKITASPYRASRSSIFRLTTLFVVSTSIVLSGSRILALGHYYHAPLHVAFQFETYELPRLLNVTGLLLNPLSKDSNMDSAEDTRIDLTPIKQFNLRLCLGKEWYRFPGHYLVPDGVDVRFVKSEFGGLVPGRFGENVGVREGEGEGGGGGKGEEKRRGWGWGWSRREVTRLVPEGFNDLNKEDKSHYVNISTCDYFIDADFPLHPRESAYEPRYAVDSATWDRVARVPFLDAANSGVVTRALWVPRVAQWVLEGMGNILSMSMEGVGTKLGFQGAVERGVWKAWGRGNSYGEYCLLRHRERAGLREGTEWNGSREGGKEQVEVKEN